MRSAVIVLGDLGRSPRMQNQARSLAELGEVDLVGYAGSELPAFIATCQRVQLHLLPAPRPLAGRWGPATWARALLRIVAQTLRLLHLLLFRLARPRFVVVQNPPPLPTLAVAWLAARLRSARLVVDWHNFGYTVLGLKLGERHPVVRLAALCERQLGRLADRNLCVSEAMRHLLVARWRMAAVVVLHDRPTCRFRPTPPHLRYDLFRRLRPQLGDSEGAIERLLERRSDRPALLVSPTSWSADEDFSLLLEAARRYDEAVAGPASRPRFPGLLVLLTGRGPLRSHYEARLGAMRLRHVILRTLWVEGDDYPLLLGAADLGLCLHRSSSALDLPIKLADMLGAELPVCALDYGPVLAERFRHGEQGLLFTDGEHLAEQLRTLLEGFPRPGSRLERMRGALGAEPPERWEPAWRAVAGPLFSSLPADDVEADRGGERE